MKENSDNIVNQLDDECQELFGKLKQLCNLVFQKSQRESDTMQVTMRDSNGNPVEISIGYQEPINMAYIYHELLHAECELILGSGMFLTNNDDFHSICQTIFTNDFCEGLIGNIEHVIIYPYFKEKYNVNDFFRDINYDTINLEKGINYIEKSFRNSQGEYSIGCISQYLNACVRFMCFPIDNRFSSYLKQLEHTEQDLYKIVKSMIKEIKLLKLEFTNRVKYIDTLVKFKNAINQWIKKHRFTI